MPIITKHVHVFHPDTLQLVSFEPGDKRPDWAADIITNPAVLAEYPDTLNESDDEDSGDGSELTKAQLIERAKELGLPTSGNKADLSARIAAAETPADDDNQSPTREALEEEAKRRNIDFTDETTDAELALLVERTE